jgi:hypothetical protein
MKKTEIRKSKVQVPFFDTQKVKNLDAMKAFNRKFSATINILSFTRGNEIPLTGAPFEPFAHIIEG